MSLAKTLWAMRPRSTGKPARFVLQYSPQAEPTVTVGHLDFDGALWTFVYAEEYKERHDLRPIEGLDEVGKVYRSPVLFPFFAVRIPDIDRDDVRRKLEEDRIRDPEATDLLRIFGRRVLSSPAFELLPA